MKDRYETLANGLPWAKAKRGRQKAHNIAKLKPKYQSCPKRNWNFRRGDFIFPK